MVHCVHYRKVRCRISCVRFVSVWCDSYRRDSVYRHGVTKYGAGNSAHDADSISSILSLNSHLRSHLWDSWVISHHTRETSHDLSWHVRDWWRFLVTPVMTASHHTCETRNDFSLHLWWRPLITPVRLTMTSHYTSHHTCDNDLSSHLWDSWWLLITPVMTTSHHTCETRDDFSLHLWWQPLITPVRLTMTSHHTCDDSLSSPVRLVMTSYYTCDDDLSSHLWDWWRLFITSVQIQILR